MKQKHAMKQDVANACTSGLLSIYKLLYRIGIILLLVFNSLNVKAQFGGCMNPVEDTTIKYVALGDIESYVLKVEVDSLFEGHNCPCTLNRYKNRNCTVLKVRTIEVLYAIDTSIYKSEDLMQVQYLIEYNRKNIYSSGTSDTLILSNSSQKGYLAISRQLKTTPSKKTKLWNYAYVTGDIPCKKRLPFKILK